MEAAIDSSDDSKINCIAPRCEKFDLGSDDLLTTFFTFEMFEPSLFVFDLLEMDCLPIVKNMHAIPANRSL